MKIALDIDGVLADFVTAVHDKGKQLGFTTHEATSWDVWCPGELMKICQDDENFWLGIPPYVEAQKFLFKPVAYITKRPVNSGITEQWLAENGFKKAPVYTVNNAEDKLGILKSLKSPIFVDDKTETVIQLNNAGILCYCLDRPWNQDLPKGYPKIKSLEELQWLVATRRTK
jgi:hypothetical protein